MAERQKHGFIFESYVSEKYGVVLNKDCYTSKWDGTLNGYPVSIKTERYGSDIEMADFRRNAINTDSFYLIVGFWKEEKENIVEEYCLFVDGDEWHSLFPEHFIVDFENMLLEITNDKSDDIKWKKMMNEQKKRWISETKNLIRPRFKRDHKTQKRVQCAINYKDFINYFVGKYSV